MVKNLKVMLVFSLILSLFISSCSKDLEPALPLEPDNIESVTPGEDGTPPPEETTPPETSKPGQDQNAFEMGTGSGDLTIDGNNAVVKGKNLIVIKAGTYNTISIKNLNGNVNAPVFIKNGGQVFIKGAMYTENINNVTIAGDNVSGVQYGFNFHNIGYRALLMNGQMNGVTIKSFSFKNVQDYVIVADLKSINYNGSPESRTENVKILNCKFDNATGIQFSGEFNKSQDNGFVKGLEIAHNIIMNSDGGVFAFFPNVQDYDIHHNIADNLNPNNNNHNGIFQISGNGKFRDNKFTNYQGNMIRAWVFSRGTTPSTVEIYNNVGYNTRKYGAFEIQGFERFQIPGKTTVVNAKVYNNTVGKMNTYKDWEGVVLDLYNYGGTLEYYNNLGFDLYSSKPITDMINNMSDVKIIKNTNNKYLKTASEAVSDMSNFNSIHGSIGARL